MCASPSRQRSKEMARAIIIIVISVIVEIRNNNNTNTNNNKNIIKNNHNNNNKTNTNNNSSNKHRRIRAVLAGTRAPAATLPTSPLLSSRGSLGSKHQGVEKSELLSTSHKEGKQLC